MLRNQVLINVSVFVLLHTQGYQYIWDHCIWVCFPSAPSTAAFTSGDRRREQANTVDDLPMCCCSFIVLATGWVQGGDITLFREIGLCSLAEVYELQKWLERTTSPLANDTVHVFQLCPLMGSPNLSGSTWRCRQVGAKWYLTFASCLWFIYTFVLWWHTSAQHHPDFEFNIQ